MQSEGTAQPELGELARMADELVEQIGAARRHYDELREALDQPAQDGAGERGLRIGGRDEAHLAALSMALLGDSRERARAHLSEAFGIDDADDIIDSAFGTSFPEQGGNQPRRRRFSRRRGRA